MKPAPKLSRPADRAAVRLPRLATGDSTLNARAAFPAAMGNRAFVRAWAARRAQITARRMAAPAGRV